MAVVLSVNAHTTDAGPAILVVRWEDYKLQQVSVPLPPELAHVVATYWQQGFDPRPFLDEIDTPEADAARRLLLS